MAYLVKATTRTETGKGIIKKLRRAGKTPAVLYGHGDPSLMLSLETHDFNLLLEDIRGHSPIVDVELDGEATRCVIKTLQRNPITGGLLHVDFQKVHAHEKITMNVPVLLHGTAAGVKAGGLLDHILREVPVRATIDRIPEHFDIDVTELQLGHSVHISDLPAEDIEFTLPPDSAVVTILHPRKMAAAAEAATAEGEAAEGEGAAPAEGEEASAEPEVIKEKGEEKKKEEK
jgi:large subunit ribosomal protein L25